MKDLAEKKHLDDKGADVMGMDPLVQIKSSSLPQGQLAGLMAELDAAAAEKEKGTKPSVLEVPMSTGGSTQSGVSSASGGRFGKKKSMRQSIRNMFTSRKQHRPKQSVKDAAGTGGGGANGAQDGGGTYNTP